jgi:hypothetical protein
MLRQTGTLVRCARHIRRLHLAGQAIIKEFIRMHVLMPEIRETRVTQKLGRVDAKSLATVDQLLVILPKRPKADVWRRVPQGKRLQALMRKRTSGDVPAFEGRLGNERQTFVVAGTIAANATAFEQLTLARKLVAAARREKGANLGILVAGFAAEEQSALYQAACAAALAAAFRMPPFKS